MLRMFLKKRNTFDDARDSKAIELLKKSITRIERYHSVAYVNEARRMRILRWCRGFLHTLRELEESLMCCQYFANETNCQEGTVQNVSDSLDYARCVYFYKNTLIRIFSILDKLGYFMDDYFELHTESIKPRFSYFTVLRRLQEHPEKKRSELTNKLAMLKENYQDPLYRLREQRNLEIHYLNIEMVEPLMEQDIRSCDRFDATLVNPHLLDLQQGYEMVCLTIEFVFEYVNHNDQSRVGEQDS